MEACRRGGTVNAGEHEKTGVKIAAAKNGHQMLNVGEDEQCAAYRRQCVCPEPMDRQKIDGPGGRVDCNPNRRRIIQGVVTAKRASVLAAEEDQNDACEDKMNAPFEFLTIEPAECPTA